MLCLPRLYAPRRAQNRFSKIGAPDQIRTGDVQEAMLTHVPLPVLAARSSLAAPPSVGDVMRSLNSLMFTRLHVRRGA